MNVNKNLAVELSRLTAIIERMTPPIPAIAPIAPIAATPAIPQIPISGDHDLLQRLDIKVDALTIAVNDLAKREDSYINKQEFAEHLLIGNDHEKRIRVLEISVTRMMTFGSVLLVLVGILQFIIGKFVN